MKISPILGLALLCVSGVAAQPVSTVPKNIRASNTLDNLVAADGLTTFDNLYGIPLEAGEVRGNTYLASGWRRTTFLLYDIEKMVEGYPSRYEIASDQFEIRVAGTVKVLSGKKVKSFVWVDSLTDTPHYFINGGDLRNDDGVPLPGFFEVLSEGTMSLLARTEAVVLKPNYHQALNMGTRDTRILKKQKFFYSRDGVIRELPSSRKKLLPLFGDHSPAVAGFIRVNTLSLDNADHLKAIFEFHNRSGATK